MTDYRGSFVDRIQQWAAGNVTGSEGDPIVSDAEIRDYLDAQVESFGTLYDDPIEIPAGFSERNQVFTNEVDMFRHWAASGMLFFDDTGNVVPNQMIAILRWYDEVDDTDYYTVYVAEDSV